MTIHEIRQLQLDLENDISKLVKKFESSTYVQVENILIERTVNDTYSVDVKIKNPFG